MALELKELILGESSSPLHTSSSEEMAEGLLALTQQARRSLDIFTQQLDHKLYNSMAFYEAVLALTTHSRHSLVRILIQDSMPVAKSGNRLVELSYRISSRVQIRKPPDEHEDFKEEFVIADGCGMMHRTNPNRYEGELCFKAAMKARQLNKFFDDCWEHSAADPQLRRLHL